MSVEFCHFPILSPPHLVCFLADELARHTLFRFIRFFFFLLLLSVSSAHLNLLRTIYANLYNCFRDGNSLWNGNEQRKKKKYEREEKCVRAHSPCPRRRRKRFFLFIQPRWCFERVCGGRSLKDSNNNNNNNNESREMWRAPDRANNERQRPTVYTPKIF